MSALYLYPDYQSLHVVASQEAVRNYHDGTRTLIHLPVGWLVFSEPRLHQLPPESNVKPRPLRVGDDIGLVVPPMPRIAMTKIVKVQKLRLHDMSPEDLVLLGRTENDLDAYRDNWDRCWATGEEDGGPWPWESNPEVYAIYWKALVSPKPDPKPCPVT